MRNVMKALAFVLMLMGGVSFAAAEISGDVSRRADRRGLGAWNLACAALIRTYWPDKEGE